MGGGGHWRRRSESNRRVGVLQTPALPLGYVAVLMKRSDPIHTKGPASAEPRNHPRLERKTRFELATLSLAKMHSREACFRPDRFVSLLGRPSRACCLLKEYMLRIAW